MSAATELQDLQRQRERELALLRSRIGALAGMIQGAPVQWVGKHPYIATASAAMAGFVAAQLPCGFSHAPPPTPASAPPVPPAPAAVEPSKRVEMLGLLLNVALQFLQPVPESSPVSIAAGDMGAVGGTVFPPFAAPAPGSA